MRNLLTLLFVLLLLSCSQTTPVQNEVEITTSDQQLLQLIQTYQQFYQKNSPFNKPPADRNNARLPNLSPEFLAQENIKRQNIYNNLMSIDVNELSLDNQINHAVLSYTLKNKLDSYINKEHYMPLTAESGFHVWIANISQQVNLKSEQDYQDYLSKLRAIPHYFEQQIFWMNLGIDEKITQPKVVLKGFEQSILAFIKEDVTDSSYYTPFKKMSVFVAPAIQHSIQNEAKEILIEQVMPAYQQYYDFMVNRYQPNARDNIAATSLPNGKNYYQNRVEHYTTLAITAEQVHQKGLAEVKRIRTEMDGIITRIGFNGDFKAFIDFLRTDEQFYAKTPRDLLKEASYIAKKMDAKLPSLFTRLPRTPYGVIEVPKNIAPKYTTGRYSGPSRDDQAGNYWVNTYRLDRRPLYALPALTLHEAVPGHHLQGSIAKEMQNVPQFRNRTYISAFGEGWGLYSEFLGIEAGIYETPYQDFGRLTYEMWRACRLVVDTGIHTKGWTRQQAIDYLANNTALSLHNVQTEIDRYISWPGQALSYKIGELTIKRLRHSAEQILGEKFDLRDFHDQILKNGSMPLSMLEKVIDRYIIEQKNS
ncbi:DUF885 domain-containing protein [Colwellia sp. 1_MG-2023]|jgi:uncharacterized protein (DUF885 family)|uniref:DUF885 domain-containing protein n=1 Tax=unclassified Colwellia TaxID=196834 RepID=UPI001C092FFA|nr:MULTISPECIES: DUF885 domain-containing protein [unclassified Colwellia]MBU2923778.1 DUF885 domain-containing protein [Colwellia sp. C2M11]MDO6654031.1 DUF885 domain-containing protein [Colwellia sp. 3_MG-2023]MDO6667002.1 DUF885 domain-containing protein [Colwellia sp. 2_MG-2023]MDO6691407.1 DUF885 domain-containing protein [Colwellia sp. 1_MG-2023]